MKDIKKSADSSFGENEELRALEWSAHSPHCIDDLTGQVMDELDEYFSTRGLTYLSGQRELLRDTVRLMLGEAEEPVTTIPLLPGMGKSTLVRALVKVLTREFVRMSDYAKSLGGVILVVEKTAEAVSAAMCRRVQNVLEKIALRRQNADCCMPLIRPIRHRSSSLCTLDTINIISRICLLCVSGVPARKRFTRGSC